MTKKLYLPFLMAMVVALMTSCSKKMGELSSDYFTVTPQVLEAVGGKVPATINGKFPEKYFNKKAVVEVTPVLKWNGGEAKGQSAVFQGEKVEGNDQTISYKMGGSYTMKTSFDYVPEMAKSELYLEFKATVGKKTVTIPAVKVADGVISTSEMLEQTLGSANPANGDDAFQRIIKEKHDANIMFLIQQANVRASELKPLVLGYILAGFLIGPYMPLFFSLADIEAVSTWSEIGIIILMFCLGLEFNLHKLASVGGTAIITALVEVGGMLSHGEAEGQPLCNQCCRRSMLFQSYRLRNIVLL